MRTASRLRASTYALALAPALALLAAGCGDDGGLAITPRDLTLPPQPDLTVVVPPDMTVLKDFAVPPDLTPASDFGGVLCGNMTCAPNQMCCATVENMNLVQTCQASCDGDAGMFVVACDGPEDCKGNPCCAMVSIGGGGMMMGGAMCTNAPNACQINLAMNAISTRLCHADADCAGLTIPILGSPAQCCHEASQPNTHVCAAPINFMGFNFQCP